MAERKNEPPKERRRGPRVSPAKPLPARVRMVADVFIRNISSGGALVESARALAPGSRCEVQIDLGGTAATVAAKVVRCKLMAGSGSRYEAGLEFDAADEKTRSGVERILKRAGASGSLPASLYESS